MPAMESSESAAAGRRAFMMRMAMRIWRARWFSFLRRVYQYQNSSRSDLASNPFNSRPWLALELTALVTQVVVVTVTMAISLKEKPVWPLRIWLVSYDLANLLTLPLLYWRFRHSNVGPGRAAGTVVIVSDHDIEQQRSTEEQQYLSNDYGYSCSYLMNKSRTFLELFFAIWFVMGNVWMFDSRYNNNININNNGSLDSAPKLHALCIALLAWNALLYSFPFLLFLLLCCFFPSLATLLGCNINSASRGASDEQISRLPHWPFKELKQLQIKNISNKHPSDLQINHHHRHLHHYQEHEVEECCCICLAKYKEREEVRQLPCLHLFHLSCVDQWLRIMSSCPLCKQQLS